MYSRLKILVLIIVLCITVGATMPAFSQEDKGSVGGYAAVSIMGTSFYNFRQWDMLIGMRGGITINRTFTIGLSFASTSAFGTILIDPSYNTEEPTIGWMYYGGIFFEYTLKPENRFHVSFPVELVMGIAYPGFLRTEGPSMSDNIERAFMFLNPNAFYGVIPGINFDINVAKFFVIGLHAGYRFSFLENTEFIKNHYDTWGLEVGILLRFGKF